MIRLFLILIMSLCSVFPAFAAFQGQAAPPARSLYLLSAALIGTAAFIAWLFYKIRSITTRIITISETVLIRKNNLLCPVCGKMMAAGFSASPRGVFFRNSVQKPFGTFIPIWQALKNTLNTGIVPKENVAWRCESCALILIDHSAAVVRNRQ